MQQLSRPLCLRLTRWSLVVALAACGPAARPPGQGDGDGGPIGPSDPCEGDETRCAGSIYQACQDGTFADVESCSGSNYCNQDLGCVACSPGFNFCEGDTVYTCGADGQPGDMVQTCAFESCSGGQCIDACGAAEERRSYIGCEYWPVDLDNAIEVWGTELFPGFGCLQPGSVVKTMRVCDDGSGVTAGSCNEGDACPGGYSCTNMAVCVNDAQTSPFAVVVSNPNPSEPVMVTLTNASGATQSQTVGAGAVVSLFPQQMGFADQSMDLSGVQRKAYKLVASAPIVAYQFNPLNNVDVFSNDGSLLIPRHAYDVRYYAVTYPTLTRRPDTNDYNGYVAVVASAPGATTVQVTPTAGVRAGAGGFAAIAAGSTETFTLQQFDVLNLEAVADGDLTGTVIESTDGTPFGVFVGHEATVLSNLPQSPCCADHLEEQLFPTSTWGKAYAIARTQQREGEPDMLRIMAQKAGTTVSITPAPMQGTCGNLGPGDFCDVFIGGDTEVSANEPILIGHYLLSIHADQFATESPGDPSLALAVPHEQFRTEYTFLIPMQYDTQYISVVAPAGSTVLLDGTDVSGQLAPFATGAFAGARILVQPGQRRLECPDGCGLEVYGYSTDVSYLFAGGLDLEQIVVE